MKRKICLILCVLFAVSLFSGCAKSGDGGENGEITLRWYARINKEADSEEVFTKASDMAKEKIGAALDIIALEDYDTKISVVNASGEDFDIVYTSSGVNNIYRNVSDGNLLALDELLPTYAPNLWASMSQDIWNGVKINGKIYGVPNQQIFARGQGFMIPTQNIELLGLDVESMKNWQLADYETYLRAIKEKTGSNAYLAHVWSMGGEQAAGFEQILGSNLPGAIRYRDGELKVVNQYESEEYKEYIRLRAKWVAEGLTSPMEVNESDVTKYTADSSQVIPWLMNMNTYKPGVETEYKKNYGIDVTVTSKSEPLITGYSLVSTMAALNSDTRYPEKSVEFLEMLNTDKDFYNLIVYGIEDKHYKKTGENRIELSAEHPYSQPNWAIGNVFNSYILPGQADDVYEQTKQINETAMTSPILGFTPDNDELKLEVASCKAVMKEYLSVLDLGLLEVESTYNEFMEKMRAAGADELVSKLNAQLEEWLNNR